MNRSLPFASLATKFVFGAAMVAASVTYAHADLDDLLGDWADAAASEIESTTSDDVSLTPASATESLLSQSPQEDRFTPADWAESDLNADQKNTDLSTRSTQSSAGAQKKTETLTETLTGHHHSAAGHSAAGHSAAGHSSVGHSVVNSGIPSNLYHVAGPSANPYVGSSHGQCGCGTAPCGCDSGIVECGSGGCGLSGIGGGCSSCGELVDRGSVHCFEGQSECRPHRRPNLPPPSTFLDLFRSRNAYTDVWAGYADETRLRVRNRSPHLDGTWKCRGCGALVEQTDNACGCGCGR